LTVTVQANLADARISTATFQRSEVLNLEPPPVADDPDVKWDYPIAYVRVSREAHRQRTESNAAGR
jgi:hypothetical protein